MGDTTVDIAELEKQHAELGAQIVKLGGKIKVTKAADDEEEEPVAKVKVERVKLDKGKKPAFLNADTTDEEDGEDASNPGKTKKAADPDKVEKTEKTEKKVEKVETKPEDDETLVYKTETIKKSAVGEAQFAIFKAMAADVQKSATDIAKAQDDALVAKLEKRADDEFPNVPGTTSERAQMLKAIAKLEEPLRKSFEAVFTQSEKLAKVAFGTIGTKSGDSEDIKKARGDFDAEVIKIAKRDGIGKSEAMGKARSEHPELFKAYQEASN